LREGAYEETGFERGIRLLCIHTADVTSGFAWKSKGKSSDSECNLRSCGDFL